MRRLIWQGETPVVNMAREMFWQSRYGEAQNLVREAGFYFSWEPEEVIALFSTKPELTKEQRCAGKPSTMNG